MRKILIAALVFPLAAFAQAGQPQKQQPPPKPGAQQGQPPGPGAGPMRGPGPGPGMGRGDPEQMERRMRVARTLGLAEALDLEPAEAVKLSAQLEKSDEKRLAIHKQLAESKQTLRRAASGEKVTAAEVDQAVQRMFAARGQLEAIDRDATQALVKDLTPDKRARAVLFLERFQRRFGPGQGGPGMMGGRGGMRGHMHGGGMGMGMGMGPMGGGMGMGAGGMCPNPDCPMNQPDGDEE
ncbi:hypothetical protein [Anaeromyxobacter sp. Fw109-5]|uniref:hypothetical protein n=1 Tax=Anaeromyxobacter sp. (strain Fw109-5) TaxID=404589 RepID=UPI000158A81C|nr:hypothetical protein [Anaeromyxobacter sp. Fw109-5]ABS28153.1 conserved hypothetical protein [Anaeromyxobacter sp. Fw109-5]